jgi:transcriptional regulator with XRE-family HTH domain
MTILSQFVHDKHTTLTALAREAGVSHAQLSRVASGKSRPSPELARRIELITAGEVKAAALLGVGDALTSLPREIGKDRWSVQLTRGTAVVLSADVLAALGFEAPDVLVLQKAGEGVSIASQKAAIDAVRGELRRVAPHGADLVDELIADRRAKAARDVGHG